MIGERDHNQEFEWFEAGLFCERWIVPESRLFAFANAVLGFLEEPLVRGTSLPRPVIRTKTQPKKIQPKEAIPCPSSTTAS